MAKQSVYDVVTKRIMEQLKRGVIPWHKPWFSYPAVNWVSQRAYRGVNALLLASGEYATWNQIQQAGGHVKKGQRSTPVVFWKELESKDEETGETKNVSFLRYYNVWEINQQCAGLDSRRKGNTKRPNELIEVETAENLVENYPNPPNIIPGTSHAYYRPGNDEVGIPDKAAFDRIEDYYSILYHELVHSTGHVNRLARREVVDRVRFGSDRYSQEELVAEIGAAMLCDIAGIADITIENQTAYVAGWLRRLGDNNKWIVQASSKAQKAVEYIQQKLECPTVPRHI